MRHLTLKLLWTTQKQMSKLQIFISGILLALFIFVGGFIYFGQSQLGLGAVIRGANTSRGVQVDNEGRMKVQAVTETDIEHASESGLAFIWTS